MKVKHISDKDVTRSAIAGIPVYWESLNDAIQTIKYILQLGGYDFESEEIMFLSPPSDGTDTFNIKDTENCVFFQWHTMEVSGHYEVTTYISL